MNSSQCKESHQLEINKKKLFISFIYTRLHFIFLKIMSFVHTNRSSLSQEIVVVVVMAELKGDKLVNVSYLS